MSSFAEYTKKKKKKEVDASEAAKRNSSFRGYTSEVLGVDIAPLKTTTASAADIAPVKTSTSDEEDQKWYQGWFKKSEGTTGQATLASGTDLAENAGAGILGMGEKLIDALAPYSAAMIASQKIQAGQMLDAEDWKEYHEQKRASEELVKKNLYDEREVAKKIITAPIEKATGIDVESMSVFDEKSDQLAQSAGQLGATMLLSATGVMPWWATTGLTTYGSEVEAGLNQGATMEEAQFSGLVSAAGEILTEKISGGIKFGGKTLDDAITKEISTAISNKFLRMLAKGGVDVLGEAGEEWLSEDLSRLGQWLTYQDEKTLQEMFLSEEAMEAKITAAIGGGVLGGMSNVTKTAVSAIKGVDATTGLTKNEEAVVEAEVQNRIKETETDNKKLTTKEKSDIRKQVMDDLEKGRISTDTIESVIGGESYNNLKSITERESKLMEEHKALKEEYDAINKLETGKRTGVQDDRRLELKSQLEDIRAQIKEVKTKTKTQARSNLDSYMLQTVEGSRLAESYNEKARRRQQFEADLSQYDSKQRAVIQKAVDSGILNNTNKTHEFVDWLARVSAEKGVSFDFVNNQRLKESGFAVEGKVINGFRQGSNITVNMQSRNELRTVVGHEITHVLEGSPELYNALASDIKTFAEMKGVYKSMYDTAFENYKNIYKDMSKEDYKKAIEKEVTADLVGEYIFGDEAFVRQLHASNRNVFEKVYNEIKYFLKTVRAGSDAEKQLLKAKKNFEKLYTESDVEADNIAEQDDVQYSVAVDDNETLDFLNKQVKEGDYYVTYKSMSFWGYDENGNAILRSPMAEYVDGQLSNAYLMPKDKSKLNWYKATETIDEATGMPSGLLVKYKKEGNKSASYLPASENQHLIKEDWSNLFFNLRKKVLKNGKWVNSDVPARYNPYEHSSDSMLNDQFSAAYQRDNLVTVKMIVPKSEDSGAYRAKYSKDATGWTEWKSGDVATLIGKQKDFSRNVYLSRYAAPVEIVPDSEVAKAYQEYIDGTNVEIPDNVVSPNLLKELKKLGVPVKESGKLPKRNVQMSISTEYDSLPKPKPSLDPTSAQLQKDTRSVREIRNDTMSKNDYTVDEITQTDKFFDEMGEFMKQAGMTYKYIGLEDVNNAKLKITYDSNGNPQKIVLSAMVKNGDYPVNFDFTSICKKRQSISLVVKELAKRQSDGKRTLDVVNMSPESLWKINEELRKEGLETACLGCFVESKRYNIQNFSTKATSMWNKIVNEVRKEQGIEGSVEYFNFAEGADLDSIDYTEIDRVFKEYGTQPNRTSPENRMRALIRSGGAMYQKYLQPSDLMTPEGIEAIKSMSSKKNNFYGILQGVYGQASPKEVMGFSPYNSEIALLPEKKGRQVMSEYIKSIGGVRMQSFSDFLVANVYDYMQMAGDLAARKLPAHAYTKEIAFAKIFGMTGIKVNMSVMFDIDSNLPDEYAGLTFVEDVNGDEEYNGVRGRFEYLVADQSRSDAEYKKTGNRPYVQSIPFDEAVALQRDSRYSKNVGIIGVGYSDNHIMKMLGDDDIRYVIPYHASSLPAIIKDASKIRKATDYTDSQTIRKLKSITDGNGNPVDINEFRKQFGTAKEAYGRLSELVKNEGWQVQYGGQAKSKFNLYRDLEKTNDPRQTVENYLEYCAKNSLAPVFDQFAEHDNYYKLIYDFDPFDSVTGEYAPQTAVSNIYDGYNASEGDLSTEALQDLIDGEMLIQNEKNRVRNEKIPSIVDSVLDQLGMKDDVQHSISDESENAERVRNGFYGEDIMFDDGTSHLTSTYAKNAPVSKMEATNSGVNVEEMPIRADYAPLTEDEANLRDDRQIDEHYFPDAMPAEVEEEYNGDYAPHIKAEDHFYEKDIFEVGKDRSQKAYMYEHPEVKPFFQAEANYMLGELNNSTKGEKFYNDQLYYDTNGEMGWFGTSRFTSEDIAYLLDTFNYTYKDIEKGLKAIIEDNGKENNAISKRIEFLIDERLRTGYTEFMFGDKIPPNQDYINLLNSQDITQYNDESWNQWLRGLSDEDIQTLSQTREDIAPPSEYMSAEPNVAPVEEAPVASTIGEEVVQPNAHLSIRPERTKGEPRMARVKPSDTVPMEGTEQVAKVLTEEPTPERKKSRFWQQAVELVGDKGFVFENLSKKTKNRELEAKWNFIRYADSKAQDFIGNGADGVKSLDSIQKEVEQAGLTKQLYEYVYHKHNIDRMSLAEKYEGAENKPVFGYSVTADVSRNKVAELETQYPEVKGYADDIYNVNNYLRNLLVEGGVISQETADLWAEMYPYFVPIRRAGDFGTKIDEINIDKNPFEIKRSGINAPTKEATGGNQDILPLFDTMAQRALQTYKAVAKNRFGVELKNTLGTIVSEENADVDSVIDGVDNNEELLQKGKNGKSPTFTVFEGGKKVTFEITDTMYEALKPTSEALTYTNKVANKISNLHRSVLTEYNLPFLVRNIIKDTQDVLVNSQHPAKTYAKFPEAIKEMASKGKWYTEYIKNGGEQNTYFDKQTNTFAKEEKSKFVKAIGMPLNAISTANNYIERLPRLAEYIASREAGRSIEVSMLDSARVTTNFNAGGDLTKFLNRNGATFLNASVQGVMQNVRNVREAKMNGLKGWAQLAGKCAVVGIPALLMNAMLWDDDEEYEELSDYVKENYYIVAKYGDGKFVRIPKGRTSAVIQNALEQTMNALTGNDEVDLASFTQLVVTNLAPNNPVEDNILAPIIQVKNNRSWYGDDLVPTRLQDLPAEEQFDESTDSLSVWLGEKTGTSPYKINYLLQQYSGALGDSLLPMITPEAESEKDTVIGKMTAPIRDAFTTDSVLKNQNVSDFYDKSDELTTNAKGRNATDEDVLANKYFNSVNAEIGELYGKKREIQNGNYSDSEKYYLVREIQKKINALAEKALNGYDDIKIDGSYATAGGVAYKQTEDGWTKINDKQLEKQNETIRGTGITESEYWKFKDGIKDMKTDEIVDYVANIDGLTTEQKNALVNSEVDRKEPIDLTGYENYGSYEEFKLAKESPKKYYTSKVVGYDAYIEHMDVLNEIRADKDANGKTISGSSKRKKTEYINSLDLDYGQKIILYRSLYDSDADKAEYNADIVEYLNTRDDISYEEMVAILESLGMKVYQDGSVSW